ncbi:MAG: rhodanese-related sulfurtransferase, partial [Pseudomonadota bacterium]
KRVQAHRTQISSPMKEYLTAAFYKFFSFADFESYQNVLLEKCLALEIKGTILLAHEGINGTVAGDAANIEQLLAFLRADERMADLNHKEAIASEPPFHRMKVRLKKEIVAMGQPSIDPANLTGKYVLPEKWNDLISDPDVLVIDTRNKYEVALGTFENAVNPNTDAFRELPDKLLNNPELNAHKKIAMFCTGGIRCEKSTAFLRQQGFEEVYHLQGGILRYLQSVPPENSLWRGECFVFDERVTVDHHLKPGNYELCRACRHPISDEDKASQQFIEGVACPHCFDQTNEQQRARFAERQKQMELAASRNELHLGAIMPNQKKHDD